MSSTSIKASEDVIYEDDYCKITDFGNGQAEYFDDRTNFYLPVDWANTIAEKLKAGKIDRANTLIAQAERKFYEDRRSGKEQKWVNTELNKDEADKMKYYLKKHGIYYEASLMDDSWIHFEVKATDDEIDEINRFIDSLDEIESSTDIECSSGTEIERLAHKLDQFHYNFDYWDYVDSFHSRQDGYLNALEGLSYPNTIRQIIGCIDDALFYIDKDETLYNDAIQLKSEISNLLRMNQGVAGSVRIK
jgi:hypothetical protein